MDLDHLTSWLDAYGQAWETRDPEAAVQLFTEDATYQETPFDEAMHGRPAIKAYWSGVPRSQDQIRFGYEILAVQDHTGIAHWWASFVRLPTRGLVKIDGILTVVLDADCRCREFREWWHKQENASQR